MCVRYGGGGVGNINGVGSLLSITGTFKISLV